MPASIRRTSVSGSREAGPIVATIFVRRIVGRYRRGGRRASAGAWRGWRRGWRPGWRSGTRPGRRRSIGACSALRDRCPALGPGADRHFGGGFELGVVVAVREEGRRLEVRGGGGRVLEFVLSPATARFVAAGAGQGPRLELLGD